MNVIRWVIEEELKHLQTRGCVRATWNQKPITVNNNRFTEQIQLVLNVKRSSIQIDEDDVWILPLGYTQQDVREIKYL